MLLLGACPRLPVEMGSHPTTLIPLGVATCMAVTTVGHGVRGTRHKYEINTSPSLSFTQDRTALVPQVHPAGRGQAPASSLREHWTRRQLT